MRRPRLLPALVPVFAGLVASFAAPARADDTPLAVAPTANGGLPGEERALPAPRPTDEHAFGPGYVIEDVVVIGNFRTQAALILRELGLHAGDVVKPADPRVEAARLRLLSLGYFLDVRLALAKGTRPGAAVLTVSVEERGTIVLNGLFLGSSEATTLWGGVDLAQTNLLGRGILLNGGIVGSSTPKVPGAIAGVSARLRAASPELGASGLSLSGGLIYSDGSEFFRAKGDPSSSDPKDHVAVNTRRVGGTFGIATGISRTTAIVSEARFEAIRAELPGTRSRDVGGGVEQPIDFSIRDGNSHLASLAVTLDSDTRSDPVLPRAGRRVILTVEGALPVAETAYSFGKGTLVVDSYHPVGKRGHAFGVHAFAGAVFGDAPYFDRFFVGDLNLLLPPRSLGLNFSTQPSRNLLDTSIERHRYDSYAGRLLFEYAVPIVRRSGFVYRGDAFAAVGAFAMASDADLRARDQDFWDAAPVDLTFDVGVRLDTYIGIFTLSFANALGRIPF